MGHLKNQTVKIAVIGKAGLLKHQLRAIYNEWSAPITVVEISEEDWIKRIKSIQFDYGFYIDKSEIEDVSSPEKMLSESMQWIGLPIELFTKEIKPNNAFLKKLIMTQMMLNKNEIQTNFLPQKIVLKEANSMHIINMSDIIWCKAEGSYTRFSLADQREIIVSKNLKEYEQKLIPFGFFRPHHSYLVNLQHLSRFDRVKGGRLVMQNADEIPVSVRKRDQIVEYLESF